MTLEAPGDDIVGFEYAAETDADRAAIDAALARLSDPLSLFAFPEGAGCTVTEAKAMVADEEQDHAEDGGAGEDHAAEAEDHAGKGEDHNDDDDEARHSKFRAAYLFDCTDTSAIDSIGFAFFATFPNAREVDVQMISGNGSQGFEVERDTPMLDLDGLI